MRGKSLIIVTALVIALSWINPIVAAIQDDARVAAEPEIIGQIILPCGCPAFVLFSEPGEYGLVIPTHEEAYKFMVTQEDGKLTATIFDMDGLQLDVFTSVPPYEKWWRESMEDWLTEGMIGFIVLDTIRVHYQKGVESVIKT